MKKFLKITGIAIAIVFSFTQCCRNKLPDETYFYMDASTDQSPLKLYIDGEYKGELPFINTGGNYDHYDLIRRDGLFLTIRYGNYKAEVRDAQGKTITSAAINRGLRSTNIANCTGPMELTQTPDFVLVAFQNIPAIQ